MNGLANYPDSRITGVSDAVEDANPPSSFAGDTPEQAIDRARTTANADPTVQARLGCPADCNLDRSVSIDELIAAVSKALGQTLQACEPADGNGDGVTIDEIVDAVSRAIGGCFAN
jgi:hypothetical protein